MKKENVKCIVCGTQQAIYSSRASNYKTCSIECRTKLLRKKPHYKCIICNNEFHIKPYRIKRLKNNIEITCSKECGNALKSKRYTGRKNPNTKYFMTNDNMFKTIDSESKAYLLGWIASDGHISNNSTTIELNKKDLVILTYLRNIFYKDLPIFSRKTSTTELVGFSISSQKIQNDLCKWLKINPGKKSHTVKYPQLSSEFDRHFIRGYFEGDGTINSPQNIKKIPSLSISSKSKDMLISIKEKIGDLGFIGKHSLEMSKNDTFKFCDYLYQDKDDVKLERKYNRYLEWIEYYSKKENNGKKSSKVL